MKTLQDTCEELEAIGQGVCNELGISDIFTLSTPVGITDHYVFSGFLGETPVRLGIQGRGNAVREYLPELLDLIKKNLETENTTSK